MANPTTLFQEAEELIEEKSTLKALEILNRIGKRK